MLFCLDFPLMFLVFMTQHPPVGQGLLVIQASRSHSDTLHSVGLLWTGDQPNTHTLLYFTTHYTHKRQTSMPPMGFESTIPASERQQSHALERAAPWGLLRRF